MRWSVNNIEIDMPCASLIYRLDDNPGIGDLVVNRGSMQDADLTVNSDGLSGKTAGSYTITGGCDLLLPWTVLIRVGAYPGGINSMVGEVISIGGSQPIIFDVGNDPIEYLIYGMGTTGYVAGPPLANVTIMASCASTVPGSDFVGVRVVSIAGAVVSDIATTPGFYGPGASTDLGVFITTPTSAWSEGITGFAVWREYASADADFIAKRDAFLAA